jgi:hypothetical protein
VSPCSGRQQCCLRLPIGYPTGLVQFTIDGQAFGEPVALVDGQAVSELIAT